MKPICFSCDRYPQKHVDCLCEYCHQVAMAETNEEHAIITHFPNRCPATKLAAIAI